MMAFRAWISLTLLAAASLGSLLALRYTTAPFVWSSFFLMFPLAFLVFTSKRSPERAIYVNLGVVVLILGLIEAYFWSQTPETRVDYPPGYRVPSHVYGTEPRKGIVALATKYAGDDPVYRVTYTINEHGLRVTPRPEEPGGDCVVFFGGSFTFGEGLSDGESLPYLVGSAGNQTYNFGFHGYGAHHMLAALESGIVESIVQCSAPRVIYQAIYDHIRRATGGASWTFGPRYVLDRAEGVIREGDFRADHTVARFKRRTAGQLEKSAIYTRLILERLDHTQSDIDLFIQIVAAAKSRLQHAFPGAQFEVIWWDTMQVHRFHLPAHHAVLDGLRSRGIKVHVISEILPGYLDNPQTYEIHPNDTHPNGLANHRIAGYVVENVLKP